MSKKQTTERASCLPVHRVTARFPSKAQDDTVRVFRALSDCRANPMGGYQAIRRSAVEIWLSSSPAEPAPVFASRCDPGPL